MGKAQNGGLSQVLSRNVRELGLLGILVLIALFANLRSGGRFLVGKNISDMLTETSMLVILAMGMMMVIITGGIDLSVGSTMALAGMVACTVLKYNLGLHPALVILIAMLVGVACGLVNGFLVAYLNILPIIATLGTMNIFRGITYLVSGGSWILQSDMSSEFMAVATGSVFGVGNMIWIAVLVIAVAAYFLGYTRKGRQIYAVGNSRESAQISGIPAKRVLLLTYTIMGCLAALGGILYVCKYAAAQGETAQGYEMNVIASCVLGGVAISGGVGNVKGVVMGAVLLGMLNNALPLINVSSFWQEAIRGLIILVSIVANAVIARRSTRKALERRAA